MSWNSVRGFFSIACEQHHISIFVILIQTADARIQIRHMRIPFELIIFGGHGARIRRIAIVITTDATTAA